ncbi:copper ABC transporter ATP-binding protein [Natrinema saccharevitans]|uniref:Copper ABC transporter ATP-binding protein n=1 Tax=Natrinema saccharevitans TaxID=301967 RepID=A0A1S8ASR6_9EURY|nr:ABC transporter ATP-binding protein [Natrinema saccharevitans]OLZ39928.1 copper ABC transporter ATP-binding protein [Natrinema saccharevitans]
MDAIALRDVTKRFGDVRALRGIDMTVETGEVFGFLGPNGAGKSTTIDLLLHYARPSSGSVTVLGRDVAEEPIAVRRRVGVLPEDFAPFETMTGRQHLAYAIEAMDADDDPSTLLERVGLGDDGDRVAADYSTGMTQRLALAMALVGEPDLLVLDEPSTGLDPHGVRRMREIVRAERDRGATVFFSSHILGQVEAVADRVAILRSGTLVAVDTIDGLREAVGVDTELRVELAAEPAAIAPAIESVDGVAAVTVSDGALRIDCSADAKLRVLDEIRAAGGTIRDFSSSEASLEDLFVTYTEGSA